MARLPQMKKQVILEGNVHGLNLDDVRRFGTTLYELFKPNIRVSRPYPRKYGKPGVVLFFTLWDESSRPNAPKIVQLELSKEYL